MRTWQERERESLSLLVWQHLEHQNLEAVCALVQRAVLRMYHGRGVGRRTLWVCLLWVHPSANTTAD
ncbi:hypothetical protein DMENIID0001_146260 [Sergentomyia squamirostris]